MVSIWHVPCPLLCADKERLGQCFMGVHTSEDVRVWILMRIPSRWEQHTLKWKLATGKIPRNKTENGGEEENKFQCSASETQYLRFLGMGNRLPISNTVSVVGTLATMSSNITSARERVDESVQLNCELYKRKEPSAFSGKPQVLRIAESGVPSTQIAGLALAHHPSERFQRDHN